MDALKETAHWSPYRISPRRMKLTAIVKRGVAAGTVLTPHRHAGGYFVASMSRFQKDYIPVEKEHELLDYVLRGYSIRMSNPRVKNHRAASLIRPESVITTP